MGEIRETLPPVMKATSETLPEWQKTLQAKEAERRRLRELPWLEKLEMLDNLRDRHLWLRQIRGVK